ncbi:HNH endonuclease, partial [Arthrobacter sp. 2RAF6]
AADFAGTVEEISRTVEFLQLVAAQAVERTRREAQAARQSSPAPGWRTGWTESTAADTAEDPDAGAEADTATAAAGPGTAAAGVAAAAGPVDDGYRNAAEFLRARLRIGIGEARRRLTLASGVLPQTGITG